jgi:hypothetical protein
MLRRVSGLVLLIFGGLAIGLVLVGGVLAYGTRRAGIPPKCGGIPYETGMAWGRHEG